jgi:hypothetical protein
MLSINAVKGFEYGSGFEGVSFAAHNTTMNFIKKAEESAQKQIIPVVCKVESAMEKIFISTLPLNL